MKKSPPASPRSDNPSWWLLLDCLQRVSFSEATDDNHEGLSLRGQGTTTTRDCRYADRGRQPRGIVVYVEQNEVLWLISRDFYEKDSSKKI